MNTTQGWHWDAAGATKQLRLEKTELPALGANEVQVENSGERRYRGSQNSLPHSWRGEAYQNTAVRELYWIT